MYDILHYVKHYFMIGCLELIIRYLKIKHFKGLKSATSFLNHPFSTHDLICQHHNLSMLIT